MTSSKVLMSHRLFEMVSLWDGFSFWTQQMLGRDRGNFRLNDIETGYRVSKYISGVCPRLLLLLLLMMLLFSSVGSKPTGCDVLYVSADRYCSKLCFDCP